MAAKGKSEEPAASPAAPEAKPKGKLPMKLILILGVAGLQVGAFFAGAQLMGGSPQVAHGETASTHVAHGEEPKPEQEGVGTTEIALLKAFKVPNNKSGRMYIYDLDIVVKIRAADKDRVEKLVKEKPGELADAVARIVRSGEPRVLAEDELKSLRMQLRGALNEIAADPELFQQVLIPRCVPIRVE